MGARLEVTPVVPVLPDGQPQPASERRRCPVAPGYSRRQATAGPAVSGGPAGSGARAGQTGPDGAAGAAGAAGGLGMRTPPPARALAS